MTVFLFWLLSSGGTAPEGDIGQQQRQASPGQQAQPEHGGADGQILAQGQHTDGAGPIKAGQVDQPVDIRRVEQQQPRQQLGVELALAEDQQSQQHQVEDQHEEKPHPQGQAGGAGFLADQAAQQIGQCQEGPAQQGRGQHEAAERPDQQAQFDILDQQGDGQGGATEADQYGQRQDQSVADKLAEQNVTATQGVGHQPHQGPALV